MTTTTVHLREPVDILAPARYAEVGPPGAGGRVLPPWCYTSEAWLAREVERLFRRSWLPVGWHGRAAAPGDYFATEAAGVPLVVVRGRDGDLRAFANTCRHRGSLLLEGAGNCRAIKCPYHGWVYALDGRLTGAPDMAETRGFDPADHGLREVRLENVEGYLFVSFDDDAPAAAERLAGFSELLAPYRLDEMVLTRRRAFEVNSNWKPFIEAFMEEYHLPVVHPASVGPTYEKGTPPDPVIADYVTIFSPHDGTGALNTDERHLALPPILDLAGRSARGSTYVLVLPAMILCCTIDCMWFFEIEPLAPDRTRVAMNSCFPRTSVARPDFAEKARAYYRRWDEVIEEDIRANVRLQRGLASPYAAAGPLGPGEPVVGIFGRWIADRVVGNAPL